MHDTKKMEDVKPVSRSAEIQMGWTALVEAFNNGWRNQCMSAEEIIRYAGVPAREFVRVGWLQLNVHDRRTYMPDGELETELARDVEAPDGQDIHVSTFPTPHVVPTPSESEPARKADSDGLQQSAGDARAGADPASKAVGRWDGPPLVGVQKDLVDMIGALRVVSEETRKHWTELAAEQEALGFPDFADLDNGTAHLLRLASDLHSALMDGSCRLQMAYLTRPKQPAKLPSR